jgi:hypothetical protein
LPRPDTGVVTGAILFGWSNEFTSVRAPVRIVTVPVPFSRLDPRSTCVRIACERVLTTLQADVVGVLVALTNW